MRCELAWRLRFATLREIGGGRRNHNRYLAGDAHRDHVSGEELASVDSGIETSCHEVGPQRALNGNVKAGCRIRPEEARDRLRQNEIRCVQRHGQAQRARRFPAKFLVELQRGLTIFERRSEPFKQTLAGRRGCNRARGALDEAYA